MKPTTQLPTFATALFVIAAGSTLTHAQSWETVYDSGIGIVYPWALSASPAGSVLAAERISQSPLPDHFVLRRSSDRGLTWTNITDLSATDFIPERITYGSSGVLFALGSGSVAKSADEGVTWTLLDSAVSGIDITANPAGHLFIVGSQPGTDMIVRRSVDHGQTWETVDATTNFSPSAIAASASAVVVSGENPIATGSAWVTRRSLDGGNTWATVGEFTLGLSQAAGRTAVGANGHFYTIGTARMDNSGTYHWIVRRSTDGGTTWTTVDNFVEAGLTSRGASIAVDRSGQIFAVGYSLDSVVSGAQSPPWLVRRSSDGGNTWQTIDKLPIGGAVTYAVARDVAIDPLGNVFVSGPAYFNRDMVNTHAIIRKLAGPPPISVSRANARLHLAWPAIATSYVPQVATTLANGGNWQDISLITTLTNGQKVATVNPTPRAAFFRLRQQ
jgi:hypothetical protein